MRHSHSDYLFKVRFADELAFAFEVAQIVRVPVPGHLMPEQCTIEQYHRSVQMPVDARE